MLTKANPVEPGLQLDANGDPILPRDRFFTSGRTAVGENARAVVEEAIEVIADSELDHGHRKRRRKERDQRTFEDIVEGVIADMIMAYLQRDKRGSAISLSKATLGERSRYKPAWMTEAMPGVIAGMVSTGYVRLQKGHWKNYGEPSQRSLIWPGERLIELINFYKIKKDEIGWSESEETIILKSVKQNYWDDAHRSEYKDTEETYRLRSELAEVNAWLANADLSFDPSAGLTATYDLRDRRLSRHFSRNSFQSGGRLFGGFWQPMSKEERRSIRIAGEPVVSLDYRQIGLRILYGITNAVPDKEDLHAIEGIHLSYRKGIKKLSSAMLFSERWLKKKPKGTKALLPSDDVATLCSLILRSHPKIAHQFFTSIGHTLQFIESEIMMKVLRELMKLNIVALPIHDALVVAASKAAVATDVMVRAGEEVAGIHIPVKQE
jgi:hypothetical protein